NLNLFGKAFPSCKSANSESNGQMQWTSLKLKGASSNELYLMCGAAQGSACAESYGAWQAASAGEADTCNGNTSSSFTCTSGVAKTCVDIVADNTANYVELGEGNNPYDECPGNNDGDKYVCDGSWSGTCIDVYDAGVKGEWLDNGNMIRLSCQNNSLQATGDGAFCTSTGVRPGGLSGADEACAELIRNHSLNGLYAGESYTCAVLGSTQELCNSLGWNATHDVVALWLVCKNMPKQRNVTCGGRQKRTVQCC
ncbi:MAG: hypothetical protein ACI37O_02325, partial [Candidatus Avelusimicrobium sp.]|uniref:hypothetical protein n=1 Tax=Candidatus Avelusimicrobium sp. TaxID=3048833 RepID=UPI003EFEBE08